MAMLKLKRIDAMSVAKLEGMLFFILGIIAGILVLISMLTSPVFLEGISFWGIILGAVFALALTPLFYGALGFVMGMILTFLCNVVIKMIGGIKLEFGR